MKGILRVWNITLLFLALISIVRAQTNQTVTNGDSTTPISFPGTGCTYNWTNSNPSIGLPATGSGNIPSFTALNNGSTPVTAIITATPASAGLAYVPDDDYSGKVSVIDLSSNSVIATIPVENIPVGVSVSPDGSWVYITNWQSASISVINAATNKVIATIPTAAGGNPSGIVVSPDGKRLYFTNYALKSVSVVNTVTNAVLSTIDVGGKPFGIAVSPDGSLLYVSNVTDGTVSVINTATNAVVSTITVGSSPNGLTLSPNGSRLYVANYFSKNISVINTANNTVIATIGASVSPVAISVSPDGNILYVTNPDDNSVSVISTSSYALIAMVTVGYHPAGLCLNPDGSMLYVASEGAKSVTVISTLTNQVVAKIPTLYGAISVGNFISSGIGCNSTPITFTITVNNSAPVLHPPNISYQTPQTYPVNKLITPLVPTNTGGSVPVSLYGQINTLAGSGLPGATNGSPLSASFSDPVAITVDGGGIFYVTELGNMLIREILPDGTTSTIAGVVKKPGYADGPVNKALFNDPAGIVADNKSNLFVADAGNNRIREISAAGIVSTYAGNGTAAAVNGKASQASFNYPSALTIDASGDLFVVDQKNNLIRKISANGTVTTFAGNGSNVRTDGPALQAGFNDPKGITIDKSGNLYVSDQNSIRMITPAGTVTTIAGGDSPGAADGKGSHASFNQPYGIAISPAGDLYVADSGNDRIRKVTVQGVVTTVAGDVPGAGSNEKNFHQPTGIVIDASGNAYITESGGGLNAQGSNIITQVILTGYTIDKQLPLGLTFAPGTGTISGTPTVPSPPTDYIITAYNKDGSSTTIVNIAVTDLTPSLSASGTLSGLSTTYGTPSQPDNFTVAANNLQPGLTITPPQGLEVSSDNTNFSNTITTGSIGNLTVTVYVRLAATTPAGTYSGNIVLSSAGVNDVDVNIPDCTVIPAPLTITADNKTKAFNTPNPPLTVTYTGFQNQDGPAQLTTQPVITTTAVKSSPIGDYPITASGASSPNYDISYVAGILSVVPSISSIRIPNAFTPNGDGINDVWNIFELNYYPRCTVSVYSRNGSLVYQSHGYPVPWDGTVNGSPVPTGTYYYIISPQNDLPKLSGYVTILH